MGNYNKITCILEIPKECRYTNSLTSLVPVFEKDEEGNITVPSQYIKAIVTVAQDGYHLTCQVLPSSLLMMHGQLEFQSCQKIRYLLQIETGSHQKHILDKFYVLCWL